MVSEEFCDGFPHHVLPTPGYWVECSGAESAMSAGVSERGSLDVDDHATDDSIASDSAFADVTLPR